MPDITARIDDMISRRLTLILTEAEVRRLIRPAELIDQQVQAYAAFSTGAALIPTRIRFLVEDQSGRVSAMPGYVPGASALGCKVVSGFDGNRERGLPSTMGTMVLQDHRTGFPLAYMGSTYLTNARTAAGAAAAIRALKKPGAATVGVYGSGVLGRLILSYLPLVMPVAAATVYSRQPENRAAFARDMTAQLGVAVQAADDPAAPAAADVVVVATTSSHPVLQGGWVRPGATVVSAGSGGAKSAEIPGDLIARSQFLVESRAAALKDMGELLLPMQAGELTAAAIYAEIGEVYAGRVPGRQSPAEIWVFKSFGIASQDLITARNVYETALTQGIGQALAIQA